MSLTTAAAAAQPNASSLSRRYPPYGQQHVQHGHAAAATTAYQQQQQQQASHGLTCLLQWRMSHAWRAPLITDADLVNVPFLGGFRWGRSIPLQLYSIPPIGTPLAWPAPMTQPMTYLREDTARSTHRLSCMPHLLRRRRCIGGTATHRPPDRPTLAVIPGRLLGSATPRRPRPHGRRKRTLQRAGRIIATAPPALQRGLARQSWLAL